MCLLQRRHTGANWELSWRTGVQARGEGLTTSCTWERPADVPDIRTRSVVVAAFGPVPDSLLRALCVSMPPGGNVTIISETKVAAPAGTRCSASVKEEVGSKSGGAESAREPENSTAGGSIADNDGAGDAANADSGDGCRFRWLEGHAASAAVLAASGAAAADSVMIAGIDNWDDEEADVQACSAPCPFQLCCGFSLELHACMLAMCSCQVLSWNIPADKACNKTALPQVQAMHALSQLRVALANARACR
jgi:hypothetical protein